MTLEDGVKELTRLFQEANRSPFGTATDPNVVSGEAAAGSGGASMGDIITQSFINTYDAVTNIISGSMGGIQNGGFWSGPEDPDAAIDEDDNPLEGWTLVDAQGDGCDVTWGADAASPSGYSLAFAMTDGSTDDETYLEQDVPITNYFRWFITTLYHITDDTNLQCKLAVQFLDEAGSAVGSEMTGTFSSLTAQLDRLFRIPPSPLAVTARVRFGVVATAGFSGTQTANVMFITAQEPQMLSVNIPGVLSYTSPSASTDYDMPYPSDLTPHGVYKTDSRGFVLGVSAKTSDTISAGTATVQVENDTQATTPGPSVDLSSGTTEDVAIQSLDGKTSYDFAAEDELHLELSADGSFSSTGEADYIASCRLLLVISDTGDW